MPDGITPPTWTPEPALRALVDQAKKDGLWFFCHYQELWFSPTELEQQWSMGRFRWWAVNCWVLRNPLERLVELTADVAKAEEAKKAFEAVLSKEKP